MKGIKGFIEAVSEKLEPNQVSTDMPTRIVHRLTHGPESLLHEDQNDFTPALVVRPKSTEDVVGIVEIANEYEIPIVPQGGRTGTYGAEGMRDCLVVDLANMNKILKLDEETYRITAQAGIRIVDYNEFLKQKGYMSLEWPTMILSSTLGSRAAVSGYNKFENTWGGSAVNIKAMEVVLANGDVVRLGRGSRIPTKNVTGFDLMSLFLGSRGTFGLITEVTEQFIDIPPKAIYGVWAFKNIEDATRAYIELLSTRYKGVIWRAKTYHKRRLATWMELRFGKHWPDDIEMLTEYHIHGETEIAEAMETIAKEVVKRHHGFWRDDIPRLFELTQSSHESIGVFMGMGSLYSDRVKDGGMGFKLIPLDPIVPHDRLVEAYRPILRHLMKIEDGKSYPALTGKLFVFEPGSAIPGELGYTKLWIVLNANTKKWDNETRKAFKDWFRDYIELVWSYGSALTGTHGFIPSDMQTEIVKREIGEKEYELMKTIKNALDPKNIMNPKIRY
ncbi:MAG: FAD-binding oxidoreductase [Pseudomonadota bacterium]